MIGKVRKGARFYGLARYLSKDKHRVLAFRNLSSDTLVAAASEMQVAASVSTRAKKQVLHLSISYSPDDPEPTTEEMLSDAETVLTALKLDGNQSVVVQHSDQLHPHIHLMINRVAANGKAVSDSQSYRKIETALRSVEAARGLTVTEGRHAPSPVTGTRMTGQAKTLSPHPDVPQAVVDVLASAADWQELHAGLLVEGWRVNIKKHENNRSGTIIVGPESQHIAAGKVAPAATLHRLLARFQTIARRLKEAVSVPVSVPPVIGGGHKSLNRSRQHRGVRPVLPHRPEP